MKTNKYRPVTFYKNYFEDFITKQQDKVQNKILWTLQLLEHQKRVPETYLKHIEGTNGLYEIRIHYYSDYYRIFCFCFFDEGQLIVLVNGFQKKSPQTPKQEIIKALKIKKEYEYEKQKK
ncbi:Phage-related protein [Chitinophaga eiseniae]|uniref:Phage-related protein n=1 Tax=Chitinophaga eiseniae TaxID=634771 RepID=A0A1T4L4N4_9BACT|nr:type II toxin-antitoxin system RelE/ParE family toxin [Chitinophaga eiseniae]SJZ49692.1 Phage-related protein [Chitinophaga eiseniae]